MNAYIVTKDERSLLAAGALASNLTEAPRPLVTLTDEELLALTVGEGEQGRTPWLDALRGRVPGYTRDDAIATGTRILLSRGLVAQESTLARLEDREPIGDPETVRPNLVATGIIMRRAVSPRRIEIGTEDGRSARSFVFSVDSDGTVLQEQISENGLHHFLIQDAGSARRALENLVQVDPSPGAAEDDGAGPSSIQDWTTLRTELRIPESSPVLRFDIRDRRSGESDTMWWVRSERRTYVLRTADIVPDPRLETSLLETARVSPGDVGGLLAEMLSPTQTGSPEDS